MRRLPLLGIMAACAAGLLGACAGADTTKPGSAPDSGAPLELGGGGVASVDPYDPDAALPLRIESLFASCSGGPETKCHAVGEAGLTLRLGPGGDVVGVRSTERPDLLRVQPFAPSASYLFLKVLGDGGIDGGRMPLDEDGDPRTPDLIAQWIEAGAPSP